MELAFFLSLTISIILFYLYSSSVAVQNTHFCSFIWVANIIPVPKKDGKVCMCVDYRDLNQASPKDNFP